MQGLWHRWMDFTRKKRSSSDERDVLHVVCIKKELTIIVEDEVKVICTSWKRAVERDYVSEKREKIAKTFPFTSFIHRLEMRRRTDKEKGEREKEGEKDE